MFAASVVLVVADVARPEILPAGIVAEVVNALVPLALK
jgi:hypothetical protein